MGAKSFTWGYSLLSLQTVSFDAWLCVELMSHYLTWGADSLGGGGSGSNTFNTSILGISCGIPNMDYGQTGSIVGKDLRLHHRSIWYLDASILAASISTFADPPWAYPIIFNSFLISRTSLVTEAMWTRRTSKSWRTSWVHVSLQQTPLALF